MEIYVCDDEEEYKNDLINLINKYCFETYSLHVFSSGKEMLENIDESSKIDIVFMDIEMKEISGLEVVQKIKKMFPSSIVFFVTSHTNYIANVFRLGAFQFIIKPINEEDFKIDFKRAIDKYKNSIRFLEISKKEIHYRILYKDIIYLSVDLRKIVIQTLKEKIEAAGKMKNFIFLEDFGFIQTHKSFLVNPVYIEKIEVDYVKLYGCSDLVPLSRGFKKDFLIKYKRFVKEKKI